MYETLTKAERFFYDQAGYSYDQKTETPEQGRERCAVALAAAEIKAKTDGMWFSWTTDDTTNREFTNEGPEYRLFGCVSYLDNEDDTISSQNSVGGVDFGPDNSPNDGSKAGRYARVIEAELAQEYYS